MEFSAQLGSVEAQCGHSPIAGVGLRGRGQALLALVLLVTCAPPVFSQESYLSPEFFERVDERLPGPSALTASEAHEAISACKKVSPVDWVLPRSNLALPFFREEAEALGFILLPPIGVSLISTELDRTVGVSDLRVGLGGNQPESVERFTVGDLDVHASNQIGRLDLWVLPFWNVYGLAGYTRSTGQVQATIDQFPFPNSPSVSFPIPIQLEGTTYGAGTTLAVGTKRFFATLDINYTKTKFSSLDSKQTALVIAPRCGVVIERPRFDGAWYVGAMYQDTAQTVELTVNPPVLGPIKVSLDQYEPDQWNYLTGVVWGIDERLQLMMEFGMGGRSYVISGVTVRF